MPALLKGVLVPFLADTILDVYLTVNFERSGAPSEYGHARQIACDG
jgi:hypothetical protein